MFNHKELEETAEATVSVGSGVSDIKEPLIKKPKLRILSSMKVVVDLDFDKYMNEKEISQLSSQLTRCYSFNNKSSNPVGLHFTSFGGRLQERFENRLQEYHNWKDVVFHNNSYLDNFFKEDLVYLTADEEAVLEELDETKVYIIGGVVDRNRHKHLCYHKAKLEGIATAKLPISQYINLTTRHVLTVNHVFEILLNWLETKDWRETLMNVIPPRKFNPEGKKKRRETTKKGKADAVRVDTDESSTSEI
ncbi:hypothetical protein G9A89_008492 [Geosiphon pyriformis]|nr:hypothetical protein G9A89_008492 [Geosiphon pyriformis]